MDPISALLGTGAAASAAAPAAAGAGTTAATLGEILGPTLMAAQVGNSLKSLATSPQPQQQPPTAPIPTGVRQQQNSALSYSPTALRLSQALGR